MAKVSFTKLGLTKNQDVKILNWNDQDIEIKQYLSVKDKMELVSNVLNYSHDGESNFANPIRLDVYTTLEILYFYTNINFTDKQKEDVLKLYDLFIGSGLYGKIIELIPTEEYYNLLNTIQESIEAIYAYQNSVMGILDNVVNDYSNLDLNASEIQKKLGDPENMALLRDVLAKLG